VYERNNYDGALPLFASSAWRGLIIYPMYSDHNLANGLDCNAET